MALPELVIQSSSGFHFRLYFPKKDQIARRREWFSGVSSRAFSLAIVAAHFFKGNCFFEAGLEVAATRFSRIEPGQVG